MAKANNHIVLRIVIASFLVIILGAVGFSVWVSQHYSQVLKERIPGWVAKSTDSVYNVSVGDISINILTRKVTLEQVRIWPDSAQLKAMNDRGESATTIFNISIPSIQISEVAWEDIIADRSIDCGNIQFFNPKLLITSSPKVVDSLKQKTAASLLKNKEKKTPFIQRISVGHITIDNPEITYHFNGDDSFYVNLKKGRVEINDWLFDKRKEKDTSRFLYSKNADILIDTISYRKPGSMYDIHLDSFHFLTKQNHLDFKKLAINTTMGREAFYKKMGHQAEMYSLNFPSVELVNLDWKELLNGKLLIADKVNLARPVMDIYYSRLYPPDTASKMGKFPHQLLHMLQQKLFIKTLNIANGNFKYTEVNDKSHKAGVVEFNNISGTIGNITNMDSMVARNNTCLIKLHGDFMRKSPMEATFNLSLSDRAGAFSVDAHMEHLEAEQVRAMAEALVLTDIKSFHLNKIDAHVQGNERKATAKVTAIYTGLDMAFQKLDDDKQPKDKKLLSFIANTFLLYDSNPMPDKALRKEDADLVRNPHRSFFNFIWKTIYAGVQKTVLRNDKLASMMSKQKPPDGSDGKGKKPGFFKRLFGKKK